MVASVHELASRAGIEMMQAGGNAVDAAVATGFALAVVHPQAGNLGGGGFMLIRMAAGPVRFIDYREKAPAAATAGMYLDARGNVIENASLVGYRAIAVPGSVAVMVYAAKKYGKLPLQRVMSPAIKLAREGYPLAWEDAKDLRDKQLARFPESRRIFQRDGNYYKAGEILRQPELASVLERIAKDPEDFYDGAMARELAAFIQKGGGLITVDDLSHYEVKEREARSVEPSPEAEAEWVKLVTAPSFITDYQNTCTPGYYNGEGTNEGQGFLQTNYPDGGVAFFALLARWREQGDFAGLIVK